VLQTGLRPAALPTDAGNLILRAAEACADGCNGPSLGAIWPWSKRISVGAGLAGAPAMRRTLLGLNQLWIWTLTGDGLQARRKELGSSALCLGGGTQLLLRRGEATEPFKALRTLPQLAVAKSACSTGVLADQGTHGERLHLGLCRLPRTCAAIYLEREWIFETPPEACARVPCGRPWPGATIAAAANDLQSVVEPEQASVAPRAGPCCARRWRAGGGDEAARGPVSLPCIAESSAGERPGAQLAGALQAEGRKAGVAAAAAWEFSGLDRDAGLT